jgi:hypothetical protein
MRVRLQLALLLALGSLLLAPMLVAQTKLNLSNQVKGPAVINQEADGNVAISSKRATDTNCTGAFLKFSKTDGVTPLFTVNCEGALTSAGGVTLDNQFGIRLRELTANGSEYIEHRAVLNGLTLRSGVGNDFTLSGNTITMAYAPTSGSNLICWYQY